MSHSLRNLILVLLFVAISLKSGMIEAQMEEWCIADGKMTDDKLKAALDWVCGKGGADCSKIQKDGVCFLPDTLKDHTSYAFNSYYQQMKHKGATCDFNSTAVITSVDPSHDGCKYEYTP